MHTRRQLLVTAIAALALPAASLAQIHVLMSGGFGAAAQELLPEFQKNTGLAVTTARGASQGTGPNAIGSQLRRGVPADVVILTREGMDELIADHRIAAGTDVDLSRAPLGVAVRAGAAKPDISTVEAFKQTLLRASSITFPAAGSATYLTETLFPKLGIAQEMAAKTKIAGVGAVAKGDAEIAIQPASELVHAPGVEYVGPIPSQIQFISVFSAAVVEGSKEADAAKKLIAFLTSPAAAPAIHNAGMEPAARR